MLEILREKIRKKENLFEGVNREKIVSNIKLEKMLVCSFTYTRNCHLLHLIPIEQWQHVHAIGDERTWPELCEEFQREGSGITCPHARYFCTRHYPNGPYLFAIDINRNVYYNTEGNLKQF